MLNSVVIVGRLTRDPDVRSTGNGTPVASFRLASDDSYARRDGGNNNDKASQGGTVFIDVTLFGNRANTVAKYMRKGSLVGVVGRLSQRKYLSKHTNTEVTVTEIIASNVEFVGPKPADGNEAQADSGYRPDYIPNQEPAFGDVDASSESSNLSGIDVVEDDLPF